MRFRLVPCVAFAALTLLSPAFAADDDSEAKARLVAAILKPYGGEAGLKKMVSFRRKVKTFGPTGRLLNEMEDWVRLPDKVRIESHFDEGGKRTKTIAVYNGKEGWQKVQDDVTELPEDQVAEFLKGTAYFGPRDLLRLKESLDSLAMLGDSMLGKRKVVGVALLNKDGTGKKWFFDRATHRLVKVEILLREIVGPRDDSKIVRYEAFLSDYRTLGGMPVPEKEVLRRDGKVLIERQTLDLRVGVRHEAKLFDKP